MPPTKGGIFYEEKGEVKRCIEAKEYGKRGNDAFPLSF